MLLNFCCDEGLHSLQYGTSCIFICLQSCFQNLMWQIFRQMMEHEWTLPWPYLCSYKKQEVKRIKIKIEKTENKNTKEKMWIKKENMLEKIS